MRQLLAILLPILLLMPVLGPVAAKSLYVPGADGVPLAVTEAGTADGPEILFLHGIGQGKESFLPQLGSPALAGHRMVAFDLRGHGMSGKPSHERDYTDPALWAGDVQAVMQALGLKKPVLVAWSYGALVAVDYVRVFGTGNLAGLVLVSSLGGLTLPPPPQPDMVYPPALLRARELLRVPELAAQDEAAGAIVPMLAAGADAAWYARAAKLALMVPPYAQAHLRKHGMENGDVLAQLDLPVLFIHGGFEASFSQASINSLLSAVPCSRASHYRGQGHAPFASAPARFNQEIAAFVAAAGRGGGCALPPGTNK